MGALKNHKGVRILLWIVIVILAVIVIALFFMRVYPVFGGRPTAKDRADYKSRAAEYFDGKHFHYPSEWELEVITPKLCETMSLNDSAQFHARWWRDYQ